MKTIERASALGAGSFLFLSPRYPRVPRQGIAVAEFRAYFFGGELNETSPVVNRGLHHLLFIFRAKYFNSGEPRPAKNAGMAKSATQEAKTMTLIVMLYMVAGMALGISIRLVWERVQEMRRKKNDIPISPYKSTIAGMTIPLKKGRTL